MKRRIEEAVVRIAKTDTSHVTTLPFLEKSLLPVLSLASTVYSATSFIRRVLYDYGLFTSTRLPIPVVSVGNITWGGTGKTPMVEFLSCCVLRAGICPLILTRGYGGGDEARLLQSHFRGTCARMGVGSNRSAVAKSALDQHGVMTSSTRERIAEFIGPCSIKQLLVEKPRGDGRVGVVLLDDGMQHWQLSRDLEIVMVNAITLWGNKLMVPRGPLRESLEELRRADVVVLHHADLVSEDTIESIKNVLGEVMTAGSIVVCSRMAPHYFFRLPTSGVEAGDAQSIFYKSKLMVSLDVLKGSIALCVCGVGCPESVSMVLEQMGSYYVECMDYLDHHNFQGKELDDILIKYLALQQRFPDNTVFVVLTEKDYLRDPAVWLPLMEGAQILVLHSSLELLPTGGSSEDLIRLLSTVVGSGVQEHSQQWGPFWKQTLRKLLCLVLGKSGEKAWGLYRSSEADGN